MDSLKWAKLCHYILYGIAFISLFFSCYFLYMNDAIEESKIGATTMIKRSENLPYEAPTIIVCPEPRFKPSISRRYNLSNPARDFFTHWMGHSLMPHALIEDTFQNRTVENLFEELSYSINDLVFVYENHYLKLGKNELTMMDGNTLTIELKSLPTFYYGQCHLIELMNANQWNEKMAVIYFGYRFEISYLNEYIKQVFFDTGLISDILSSLIKFMFSM